MAAQPLSMPSAPANTDTLIQQPAAATTATTTIVPNPLDSPALEPPIKKARFEEPEPTESPQNDMAMTEATSHVPDPMMMEAHVNVQTADPLADTTGPAITENDPLALNIEAAIAQPPAGEPASTVTTDKPDGP